MQFNEFFIWTHTQSHKEVKFNQSTHKITLRLIRQRNGIDSDDRAHISLVWSGWRMKRIAFCVSIAQSFIEQETKRRRKKKKDNRCVQKTDGHSQCRWIQMCVCVRVSGQRSKTRWTRRESKLWLLLDHEEKTRMGRSWNLQNQKKKMI